MKLSILHFKRLDWTLITCIFLLIGFGLLSLYSSSIQGDDFLNFKKQLIFIGIGVFLMFSVSFLDWRFLKNEPYLILLLYVLGCLSLAGLFFFAPEIRAVKGWYKVGPFSIDPIEFIKIVLIILLAKYFSVRHIELYNIKHVLFSGLYILVPAILIFLQPDLGQVLMLVTLWLAILLISKIEIKPLLILLTCMLLILSLSWAFLLKDYQKERVLSFVAPQLEPLGAGWSRAQAEIAIGSGGIFGKGFSKGPQTQYGFLPEVQTDFTFSSIAEEFGLFGVSILFSIFLILIWRIIKIALNCRSNFPRLFASGLATLLFFQIFIHVGMNLGILPIIGISMPFVSYGGSSLIAIFIGIGILQNIKINQ